MPAQLSPYVNNLPKAQKFNGLDHLRAVAIGYVFLFHYCKLFAHPHWIESIGAETFIGMACAAIL